MNAPALMVRELSVWIRTGSGQLPVVDQISFDINAGDATGLVGESGCGKTMTAMAILGLLPAPGVEVRAAAIEVNGKDIYHLSDRQRRAVLGRDIAMVFQQPATALDPVFTIGKQISAVYRRHSGGQKQDIRQSMLDALENVGFSDPESIASTYPHQLSGGMRQLAMIAMATVCKPAVIIADEPTTSLDNSTTALILQQLDRLRSLNRTAILFISHDLTVVRQLCRDVMVMYCGRLMEIADCQNIFEHPRHPYSAGLISCIPPVSQQRPVLISSIPGQIPAAAELPSGCHFAPRCTRTVARCQLQVPGLDDRDGHGVACFRPL